MKLFIILLLAVCLSGEVYADWFIDMREKVTTIERTAEMEKFTRQFPFLQVLDDYIEGTSGIRFYKVKDTRIDKIYEVFYVWWEKLWRCRKADEDGRYWFWNMGDENNLWRKKFDFLQNEWMTEYKK